jgi:hypothetical protein
VQSKDKNNKFAVFLDSGLQSDVTQECILQPQNFKNMGVSVKIKGSLSKVM